MKTKILKSGLVCMLPLLMLSCKQNALKDIFNVNIGTASDVSLKTISVTADGKEVALNKAFNAGEYNYSAVIRFGTKTLEIKGEPNNSRASVSVSPKDVLPAEESAAGQLYIITVESENKKLSQRYTVQVNRTIPSKEARADSLVLYAGDGKVIPFNQAFYPGKYEYTADIPENFSQGLRLKASPYSVFAVSEETVADAASVTAAAGEIVLETAVKAEDGSKKVYSVKVLKTKIFSDGDSDNLNIDTVTVYGKLAVHNISRREWTAYVPMDAPKDRIVNNIKIQSYALSELTEFDNADFPNVEGAVKLYLINVHNNKGKSKNFKLKLTRGEACEESKSSNADLLKIEFETDSGKIPYVDCVKNKSDFYEIGIPKRSGKLSIIATPADEKAFVSISPSEKTVIEIDVPKDFKITVRAENGNQKEYVVRAVKSLNGMVRVLSDSVTVKTFDQPWLEDVQKANYMLTGSFYKNTVEVSPFEIGMYEVTYDLWHKVRKWAEANFYVFRNLGCEGSNTGKLNIGTNNYEYAGKEPSAKKYNPVTAVSYRDIIVWCNAYSEMNDLSPVYYFNGEVLRDATSSKDIHVETNTPGRFLVYRYFYADKAELDLNANGYRLPTRAEWEFAARGGDMSAPEWLFAYPGVKGYENGKTVMKNTAYAEGAIADYVWYSSNAKDSLTGLLSTHEVGEKKPNSLNLYDMGGNVYEICSEISKYENPADSYDPRYIIGAKGGSYKGQGVFAFMSAFCMDAAFTETKDSDYGFRLARTVR